MAGLLNASVNDVGRVRRVVCRQVPLAPYRPLSQILAEIDPNASFATGYGSRALSMLRNNWYIHAATVRSITPR
jgi:hypothetical protein